MFELNNYNSQNHPEAVVPGGEQPAPARVTHQSLLLWAEHCVECAAPACYQTCDLYEKRRDGHCRRFSYGIHANRAFQSSRGFGAEVAFRKWGKLEARGSVRMFEAANWKRLERGFAAVIHSANFIGRAVWRITGDLRWSRLSEVALARTARDRDPAAGVFPNGFLLEVYNPGPAETSLEFVVRLDPHARASYAGPLPPFQATATLPAGFSRHFFEAGRFRHIAGSGRPFLVSLTPPADTAPTLVVLEADFVVAATPIKCIVWDLDGTLWDGVLAESPDVKLRPWVKGTIRSLDQRGILHSIASKNDHEEAWRKLEEFGIAEYFLEPRIGWGPKSESVRGIAQRLNLGVDSFAFVDDSAFERAEVAATLPEVYCVDAVNAPGLLNDARLQGAETKEASQRREYYRAALERESEQAKTGGDYPGFLASCEIHLRVDDFQAADFDRVAELLQRTNQLNFSGRHYSREDLSHLLADSGTSKLVLRCKDRFGDYGTVGFSLIRWAEDHVTAGDFMLSCRVQSKGIEQAFFSYLRKQTGRPLRLVVNFRQSARNKPASGVLQSLQFEPRPDGRMELAPDRPLVCGAITVEWIARAEVAAC
jgi:FkbH-like protein